MKLYELIKQKREDKGYTQDDVARFLNVTRQAVQNWEKNKRAIPNDLLADYFGFLGFNAHEILSVFGFIDSGNLMIKTIDYSKDAIKNFEMTAQNTTLTNYPTVYLGIGKRTNEHTKRTKQLVYVGEARRVRLCVEQLNTWVHGKISLMRLRLFPTSTTNHYTLLGIQNSINQRH